MANYEIAHEHLRELDRLRTNQESIISKINKIHAKLLKTMPELAEKYGDTLWMKLRNLYDDAKQFADEEDRVSQALIAQIETFLAPGQTSAHRKKSGGEQKRKRMKAEADTRLSSPSISLRCSTDHPVLVGDQVAAKISPENAEKDDWIVVKVIRFDRETNRLEVIDEEPGDDEESVQRKYKLPSTCIIPFPKASDPSSAPDFAAGSQVLAVYPGTTALYKAVVAAHRKRKTDEYYLLEFDDDEEEGVDGLPQRNVPFYQVVQLPEGHRQ
ncbi:hypothetical protein KP509_19G070500 [Ceratopteris richardii]|uniref:SGF29 C-terminal domain-containing protein n=1 Tax=Ceratopteris richardii TaxID=49495 RepID=A0A8T2SQ20_CERRI|nr:hypothetical protein KP509_19G070500 [Ceratopteris richardii]KAH7352934.1 hypothetical protein KP509_19G070500 [Ceratopteris richardii]